MTNKLNVVVGVDGSPDSEVAVRWAEHYAALTGADLTLVTAWHWPTSYGVPMAWEGWDPADDAEQVVGKAAAGLGLSPDRVHQRIECGSAGDVLVRASADELLLVVGTRGHGTLAAAALGSVSSYCVHHANCPVVVVR